jgi:hypothetical protein
LAQLKAALDFWAESSAAVRNCHWKSLAANQRELAEKINAVLVAFRVTQKHVWNSTALLVIGSLAPLGISEKLIASC